MTWPVDDLDPSDELPYSAVPYQASQRSAPPSPPRQYRTPTPGYPYPCPYPTTAPPTNTLAVLALVFSFVFAPAAVVCGHIARGQIRRSHEHGDALAVTGLVLGYLHLGFLLVICGAAALMTVIGIGGLAAAAGTT